MLVVSLDFCILIAYMQLYYAACLIITLVTYTYILYVT